MDVHWMFPDVPWMFTGCSLDVHWMFTGSSLNCSVGVHWMFTGCSLDVHWMFTEWFTGLVLQMTWMYRSSCSCHRWPLLLKSSLDVHWMFTGCSLDVHWMFAGCSLDVHWMVYWSGAADDLDAQKQLFLSQMTTLIEKFTGCSLDVHWMFTGCSLNVHWMVYWSGAADDINAQEQLFLSQMTTLIESSSRKPGSSSFAVRSKPPPCLPSMIQLVKHAPPLITKNPTTSAWHHQRWVITRFIGKEFVVARRWRCHTLL
jgi:hypothetical protein